jgi:hypothetical protein
MIWGLISFLSCSSMAEGEGPAPSVLQVPGPPLFRQIATDMGLPEGMEHAGGLLFPVEFPGSTCQLSMQHFPEERILYLAINDYHWLDRSRDSRTTAFTLTQMATQNHSMLGAKLQLNPTNGAITLGTEIPVPNGVDPAAVEQAARRLITLAKDNHAMLGAALGGDGY